MNFLKSFGINGSANSVGFSATSAYLTINDTDNYETLKTESSQLNFDTTVKTDTEFSLTVANKNDIDIAISGTIQEFSLKLVFSDDKKTDKWYREHTKACVDFVLTGLDPYWLSDDK